MVLTRAQRAQKTTPDSPLKASVLNKAPARRGRAKKVEEPEPVPVPVLEPEKKAQKSAKPAAKKAGTSRATSTTKSSALKSSTGRAAAGGATAATKVSAAKIVPAKAETAVKTSRAVKSKATTKASCLKPSISRVEAGRKAKTAAKSTKTVENIAKESSETLESTEEALVGQQDCLDAEDARGVETRDVQQEKAKTHDTAVHADAETGTAVKDFDTLSQPAQVGDDTEAIEPVREPPIQIQVAVPSQIIQRDPPRAMLTRSSIDTTGPTFPQEHEEVGSTTASPSRLPVPSAATHVATPAKSSVFSSVLGVGSVRKATSAGVLFGSPAKPNSFPPISTTPTCLDSPRRNVFPSALLQECRSMAPVRPHSSGNDVGATTSPKRQIIDGSTAASAKRLKTVNSMPQIRSQQALQTPSFQGLLSPTKSSLRPAERRPGDSPKKVSWHQTPPRAVMAVHQASPAPMPGILEGCVFFLDINSLDGTNQNGLFAGLVEELGGVSVDHWMHNNMGITHVLFMNGEMRTLEKVLASNDQVWCVSLGWLLDCQREGVRIPEQQARYLIDLSCVPGHTPRPGRTALNTPMASWTPGPISHTPALPPPRWALASQAGTPREVLGPLSSSILVRTPAHMATKFAGGPPPSVGAGSIAELEKENISPMCEATPLVQKTCPPKQLSKAFFPMSSISGIRATPFRNKLLASKRRRSFDGVASTVCGSPPCKGLGSPRRFALTTPMKRR